MKKIPLFALLLLAVATGSFAQTAPVFQLNKLSKNDISLSGWVFHPGDNVQWASAAYDDSKWEPVDPGQDISGFKELKTPCIGWIRLHLRTNSHITQQPLGAWIAQYVASEVYLNGRQILKYGVVSSDPSRVIGYLPPREPVFIDVIPNTDNVIAVRLAYEPGVPYLSNLFETLPAFKMSINSYSLAMANYRVYQDQLTWFILWYTISGSALLIISFIHLVFFLFDRSQKLNLYYFLFCLFLSFDAFPNELWGVVRFGPVATQMWVFFADSGVVVPAQLFMLITIYTLFDYTRRLAFFTLTGIGLAMLILQYFYGTIGDKLISGVFPAACVVEGGYVCFWAIRQHKKDAVFILAGVSIFLVLNVLSNILDQTQVLTQALYELGLVSFPIGMSFYLGVQNAFTNKRLKFMLAEVQTLSAQKQQLLTDQNELLEQQVGERTAQLNQSLTELRSTQTQLIQAEKMASLGELTAGIAHEIQNPLNFVNNFSEVNKEMLEELKAESEKPKAERDERLESELIDDLIGNSEKIHHHGKRADSIVKGMLEHSRVSTGQKEPTDLNKLTDEYIRLAYRGFQEKDKSFNAGLVTHYDEKLPLAKIVSQEMGRVMLNLFNNAFYAVNEKAKTAGPDYKPTVIVSTAASGNRIVITVRDNGNGIPDALKDKIMQPFFTTKPTGEGTGLGLSLSYDIVVKGHGGQIDFSSEDGEGTTFKITLPP